ncbi:hypothetical protein P9112_012164 [Eukaryota sp. TZLM1-RC]
MAPVMFVNFENNFKLNYEKHVNRSSMVYFDRTDVERIVSKNAQTGWVRNTITYYNFIRFHIDLNFHKKMFLVDDRDYLGSLSLVLENISDLLDDEFLNLCQHHDIRNNEREEIFYGLVTPFTCQIENLVMDEGMVDNIFPVDVHLLPHSFEKDFQIFLNPAIRIAQYIANREEKLFHINPIPIILGPGYFPIDMRTIWTTIKQTLMDDLLPKQRLKMVNTQDQIYRFKPTNDQTKDYKFYNTIQTD